MNRYTMRMRWAQSLSERLTGERVTPPSRTVTWASAAACHHCATEERRSTEGRTDRARWHGWSGWKKAATFTVTGKHTNVVVFSLSFFFYAGHTTVCACGGGAPNVGQLALRLLLSKYANCWSIVYVFYDKPGCLKYTYELDPLCTW